MEKDPHTNIAPPPRSTPRSLPYLGDLFSGSDIAESDVRSLLHPRRKMRGAGSGIGVISCVADIGTNAVDGAGRLKMVISNPR